MNKATNSFTDFPFCTYFKDNNKLSAKSALPKEIFSTKAKSISPIILFSFKNFYNSEIDVNFVPYAILFNSLKSAGCFTRKAPSEASRASLALCFSPSFIEAVSSHAKATSSR